MILPSTRENGERISPELPRVAADARSSSEPGAERRTSPTTHTRLEGNEVVSLGMLASALVRQVSLVPDTEEESRSVRSIARDSHSGKCDAKLSF